MAIQLLDKFKYLPDEIVQIIINYTNIVVYRHGKYMNRLNKSDNRNYLVSNIPRPIFTDIYKVVLWLPDKNYNGYFLNYDTSESLLTVNVRYVYREKDGFDKYYKIRSNTTYLFCCNNKWCKVVDYLI
jgi:hypothetical protein